MSKKIIAIIVIAITLFVCVFTACDNDKSDSVDSLYVTDENGEKVLDDDGRFLVYETDANGEIVTDKSGENVTDAQIFEPTLEDGVLEDYGFKLTIPEGWKVSEEQKNIFVKKDKSVEVRLVEKTYDDYYKSGKQVYEMMQEKDFDISIVENPDFVKNAEKAFRLTVYVEGDAYITTVFLNNGNLYNVTLKAPKDELDVADAEAFLNGFEFKPFTYYPELTEVSTEENSEEGTAEISTETTTK